MKREKKPFTKAQVLSIIRTIPKGEKVARAAAVCGLVGHSRLRTFCFGYHYCGRCDAQLGDSLGGAYVAKGVVVECHGKGIKLEGCDCREVAKTLTWRDTLLVDTPVAEWLRTGKRHEA